MRGNALRCEAELDALHAIVTTSSEDQKKNHLRNVAEVAVVEYQNVLEAPQFMRGTENYRRVKYRLLQILSEYSTLPEFVRPAVSDVIATLEDTVDASLTKNSTVACPVCDSDSIIGKRRVALKAVEFIDEFSKQEPSSAEGAIPVLIDILESNPELSTNPHLVRHATSALRAVTEEYPSKVAAGLDIYFTLADRGSLPIPPESSVLPSEAPRIRDNIADILVELVRQQEIEPGMITDGLGTSQGPFLETMTKATARVAEYEPGLLPDVTSELIALLDLDSYHYTTCGAAATALGHLNAVDSQGALYTLYHEVTKGEYGGTRYVQQRVADSLEGLEGTSITNRDGDVLCEGCNADLTGYRNPTYCPDCGIKLSA